MHIELVIWALDGTLFEASPTHGKMGAPIASRADMIRAFNDYGVTSTICAQADAEAARARLMAAGLWPHISERHEHEHSHEALAHTHRHRHDAHHQHDHDFPWDGVEPHVHAHRHEAMTHRHAHYPDIHHRHDHVR